MNTSKLTIKAGSGSYSFLDKTYEIFIRNLFSNSDEDTYERWLTYDTIIKELILLDKLNYFDELKYRVTGGDNPIDVLMDIINKDNETRTYLWTHLQKLKEYKNEDLTKRFRG